MDSSRYFKDRLSRLNPGEALNVTGTTPDGSGIKKVRFDPRTARSLVEVPNNKGFVFNRSQGLKGLDNFLRLRGYDRERIQRLHQQLENRKVRSPRRAEDRDLVTDLETDLKNLIYGVYNSNYRDNFVNSQSGYVLKNFIQSPTNQNLQTMGRYISPLPSQLNNLSDLANKIKSEIIPPFSSPITFTDSQLTALANSISNMFSFL